MEDPADNTQDPDVEAIHDDVALRAADTVELIELILRGPGDVDTKIKLISEVRKARPALQDRWLYRFVVWFLGVTVLVTVAWGFWLAGASPHEGFTNPPELPDGLIALGAGAAGALAGLLSPASQRGD